MSIQVKCFNEDAIKKELDSSSKELQNYVKGLKGIIIMSQETTNICIAKLREKDNGK